MLTNILTILIKKFKVKIFLLKNIYFYDTFYIFL